MNLRSIGAEPHKPHANNCCPDNNAAQTVIFVDRDERENNTNTDKDKCSNEDGNVVLHFVL